MLPLTLLLVTRGIRDGRLWAWGALALTIGLALLSPHPQLFQYMLLTSGCFALYVAFGEHPGLRPAGALGRDQAPRAGRSPRWASGCSSAPMQFWPALFEYKPWSPRSAGHDYATATSYSFPIEELLNAYWPQFSGILELVLGPQRHSLSQRLLRRRGADARRRGGRADAPAILPPVLGRDRRARRSVGARRLHAVLQVDSRDSVVRREVLPRAEHDDLRRGVRGVRAGGDRDGAADRASREPEVSDHLGRSRAPRSRR